MLLFFRKKHSTGVDGLRNGAHIARAQRLLCVSSLNSAVRPLTAFFLSGFGQEAAKDG